MKFGIIGTNFVSDFFMKGIKEVEEASVVAVCATSIEKAQLFANKYNIPYLFDDYHQIINNSEIEAIYIATPNRLHLEMTLFFLQHQIPVFLEKPAGCNAKEVKQMIEYSKKYNCFFQEGLIPMYHPNYHVLKNSLELVGPIHQVTLNFSKYSSRYDAYLAKQNPTTFRSELCNGALMDLGIYVVGFCVGLFGKPNNISSMATLLSTKADVSGCAIFEYDNFVVNLSYSKASDTHVVSEVCGEKGEITINQLSVPTSIIFHERLSKNKLTLSLNCADHFSYEIEQMIEDIKNHQIESSIYSHQQTIIIHEIMEETRKKAGIIYPID